MERIKQDDWKGVVKKMLDPRFPTEGEVEEHERFTFHIGIGARNAFEQKEKIWITLWQRKIDKLSEYCVDYCFPGYAFGYKLTVLAGKERLTKNWMATAVPTKGSSGMFAVDKYLKFIQELGDNEGKIVVKK